MCGFAGFVMNGLKENREEITRAMGERIVHRGPDQDDIYVDDDIAMCFRRLAIIDLEGEEGFKYIDEYRDGTTERGRKMREYIARELGFESIEFQTVEGACEAIGIPADELCTYCWDGRE